jgi:hypothetical protein
MAALKGAFINLGAGILGALPNIIVFQFNPDQISRSPAIALPPQASCGEGTRDASHQPCDPKESISFSLRLDASDQLASLNPIAAGSGILPALSALEMLMAPKASKSLNLIKLSGDRNQGHKFPPLTLDRVLFFWGPFRILPVNITSLSITETEYDQMLNPVRAEVSLNLEVLTPSQLDNSDLGLGAYKYTQGVKQVMAALNLANMAQLAAGQSFSLPI